MSVVEQMLAQTGTAAAAFESRWTMHALQRVDADLHQAVEEQQQLFHVMLLLGDEKQIKEHGEAMCRGWAAAVARMEQHKEPDDSYLLGFDPKTGTKIAIAEQRSASARVRDLHGERIIFLTPDEVAAMFAGLQTVATVKALWPGAEIMSARGKAIERYPDEPAQEDH
jgi:hypothetical protein